MLFIRLYQSEDGEDATCEDEYNQHHHCFLKVLYLLLSPHESARSTALIAQSQFTLFLGRHGTHKMIIFTSQNLVPEFVWVWCATSRATSHISKLICANSLSLERHVPFHSHRLAITRLLYRVLHMGHWYPRYSATTGVSTGSLGKDGCLL